MINAQEASRITYTSFVETFKDELDTIETCIEYAAKDLRRVTYFYLVTPECYENLSKYSKLPLGDVIKVNFEDFLRSGYVIEHYLNHLDFKIEYVAGNLSAQYSMAVDEAYLDFREHKSPTNSFKFKVSW